MIKTKVTESYIIEMKLIVTLILDINFPFGT